MSENEHDSGESNLNVSEFESSEITGENCHIRDCRHCFPYGSGNLPLRIKHLLFQNNFN